MKSKNKSENLAKMKTCVILAGGKSSRMGRDKTLLPFGDFATLTHFQVHKFAQIFERVFVSSKFDKFSPPLRLIKDLKEAEFSPMLALYSILLNFKDEHVFIIPADMPFLSERTIKELFKFTGEFDMVVPKDGEFTHSLCGFFSTNLAQKAKELYEKNENKIGILRSLCRCKEVGFKGSKEFFNINDPQQYELALKMSRQ